MARAQDTVLRRRNRAALEVGEGSCRVQSRSPGAPSASATGELGRARRTSFQARRTRGISTPQIMIPTAAAPPTARARAREGISSSLDAEMRHQGRGVETEVWWRGGWGGGELSVSSEPRERGRGNADRGARCRCGVAVDAVDAVEWDGAGPLGT
ncbi:hypothetical protein DFH09DRAFT_1194515 [Mycena vulgaris]|nr:hypothetical protein DFH09DRAFT_1194515 [Mycena vulgaris]